MQSWLAQDAILPIYGIDIGSTDGFRIVAAWTGGFWIAQDGKTYKFDFDFEALAWQEAWGQACCSARRTRRGGWPGCWGRDGFSESRNTVKRFR